MQVKLSLSLILLCISFLIKVPAQNNARMIPFYDKWPMMQDRQGYIWYVENSGRIGKYLDGDRFSDAEIFDEFEGCDYVNIIKEDIESHIWIATGCRFYRFDPVRKKFEDIQQQILDQTKYVQEHTESWYEDTSGTVWFGGSALISYSLKSKKVTIHERDLDGKFDMRYNLFGGTGRSVWFSNGGGRGLNFNQYDPVKQKIIRSFNFDVSTFDLEQFMTVNVKTEKIIGGRPESYLVYIGARLLEFDAQAGTLNAIQIPDTYGKATEIGNNGLYNYVGTSTGSILRYDPESKNLELIWQHADNKPIEIIFTASTKYGAYAYIENNLIPISTSPPLFKRILDLKDSTKPKLSFNAISYIMGKTYLSEKERLVPVYEKTGADTITFQPKLQDPENMIYVVGNIPGKNQFWQLVRYFRRPDLKPMLILRDSSGNLLQAYQSPLLDSILKRSFVLSIVTDRNKNAWITTYGGDICLFNMAKNEFRLIETDQFFRMSPPKTMVDTKSNVWVSNSTSGLVRYESEKGIFQKFLFDPSDSTSIASNHTTTTYEVADGDIWIGTKNKGISIMDPETGRFRHLNKLNGLPELTIADITSDKNGVIWVATRQYIARWLPEQSRFIVYRKQDGISLDASFSKNVFLQETDGTMLLASHSEILSFKPDSLVSYSYPIPSILLTGFSIGDKPVVVAAADSILPKAINFMKKISLDYAQNKFTIQYAAVDFYGNIEYAYRLSGFDNDWQYVKNKTEAMYTNVPPGKYEFQVKVANHQGYWSEVRSLPIYVRAPWYRTWLAYSIYALAIVLLARTYFRFRSRKLIQENLILEGRITKRTKELSDSLNELKETQNQMVQREKMASLGELTAGIAHEIQNPLNFVNNFSEVNVELTEEIIESIDKGDLEEAKELAADIRSNQEKIREHGKRADGIVKSMLQHSRTSTGQKELINLNILADEYLRLSYHGMRAKDKSFNSDFELIADPELPMIKIIPQDIGRVILNLINNAFYAVNEKKKISGDEYKPKVTVSLRKDPESAIRNSEYIQISIADNGTGIPDKVKEKIFQPFFTTKPTGEGTGLGLSLSYDIIVAHNGTLKVESKEGSGTEFMIQLPLV
jgi:signal transduction histidine kinase/streptogramin lyase